MSRKKPTHSKIKDMARDIGKEQFSKIKEYLRVLSYQKLK